MKATRIPPELLKEIEGETSLENLNKEDVIKLLNRVYISAFNEGFDSRRYWCPVCGKELGITYHSGCILRRNERTKR